MARVLAMALQNPTRPHLVSEAPSLQDLRPPLKWAGGKRWLVLHLRPLWDRHAYRRLVEPFFGGLAVTLGLQPERALLNDINPHLINFYHWVRKGLCIDMPMRNSERSFYAARTRFNQLLAEAKEHTQEAAALFYYLNRTGYNGLCRFNSQGGFNVPFGRYQQIKYVRDFSHYVAPFSRWQFNSSDFEKLNIEPDDFVYADPPYDVQFTNYAKEGFGWDDQMRLAEWLAEHPGPVVLSNQATARIVKLYRSLGFSLRFLSAPRLINVPATGLQLGRS